MGIIQKFKQLKSQGRKAFAILLDPDKVNIQDCQALAKRISQAGIDFVFVGGSLLMNDSIHKLLPELKKYLDIPLVLFPGSVYQVSPDADGILFLSLISGRNPEMLIGQHVVAAPLLKQSGIEVMPTGYMLIDTGNCTTVNYMSNTRPIPYDKPEIAVCTAMAGEMLGLRLMYMDGGSGAGKTISTEMISAVSGAIDLPLIIGGGIRNASQAEAILKAGADIIVIGNALEKNGPLIDQIPQLVASF